ncbi:hypothetical protein SDC9_168432 [bioreactor metagenome]|uniref:Uncharacterized protein n=1 Tax=bioreactor metagenome TaxID=1076179 RepID=A0A645GAZ2_9ZZZZ
MWIFPNINTVPLQSFQSTYKFAKEFYQKNRPGLLTKLTILNMKLFKLSIFAAVLSLLLLSSCRTSDEQFTNTVEFQYELPATNTSDAGPTNPPQDPPKDVPKDYDDWRNSNIRK